MRSTPPPAAEPLTLKVERSIADVDEAAWEALRAEDDRATPFMAWRWLEAMEHSGSASEEAGWSARHITLRRGGRLVAAAPAWLRTDSDGDFSRDWGWAAGAERARLRYYPKLCVTVPFTPVTGRRLLTHPAEERAPLVKALVEGALAVTRDEGASNLQVLFPLEEEARELEAAGLAVRLSYQYHWRNEGYSSTEDFLARLDAKRRHQHRRERAEPGRQGITIRTVRGDELRADARGWAKRAFDLHRSTVDKLPWGRRWIQRSFYERVFPAMADNMEVVAAEKDGRLVAGAFNVSSRTHLYGRYWGCFEEHRFLHFNVCLYHSIDDCIARGLRVFEGGAGGEHKMARGFLPSETWSAHAFLEPRLDSAVRRAILSDNAELERGLAQFRSDSPILKGLKKEPLPTAQRSED